MTQIDTYLIIMTLLMICWNVYLNFRVKTLKSLIKDRKPDIQLEEFIADVYAGGGLLRVERIDSNNLFLRSPRDKF